MNTKTAKYITSALPSFLVAMIYLWPLINSGNYLLWTNLNSLSAAMRIEWLVLAAGLFCIPLLVIPSQRRLPKALFFYLFASGLGYGAYTMSGWVGLAEFVGLLTATYGGSSLFFRDENQRNSAGVMALIRFIVAMMVFFPLIVVFDIGDGGIENWKGKFIVVQFGATFFSILFFLELTLFAWLHHHAQENFKFIFQKKASAASPVQVSDTEARRRRFYEALKRGHKRK